MSIYDIFKEYGQRNEVWLTLCDRSKNGFARYRRNLLSSEP